MTRINCVPPEELTGPHLVAEYRELPRIFSSVFEHVEKDRTLNDVDQPAEYKMGKGHMKFFYDKLLWLSWRHVHIVNEMERRGYKPNFRENLRVTWSHIPSEYWNDWEPTEAAIAVSRARIADRLANPIAQQKRKALFDGQRHSAGAYA